MKWVLAFIALFVVATAGITAAVYCDKGSAMAAGKAAGVCLAFGGSGGIVVLVAYLMEKAERESD